MQLPELLQDACFVLVGPIARISLYRLLRKRNVAVIGGFDVPHANSLLWASGGAALSTLEAQGAFLLLSWVLFRSAGMPGGAC